ncbi:MAG: Spy/CpxP family protein refolding chaperone [Pseudomonadota bacterium]|nr:Spy/CpxP family protein refolding chaperone [Pseudomonadota bacterium]
MKLPASIARFQRSLGAVAVGVLLTTAQAWAVDDRKKIDWESSLNLTEEQQTQIDAIEDKYRDRFRELKASEAAPERRGERRDLHLKMRDEIRAVLTDEQQALAEEQVRRREKDGREDHLDRLTRDLSLTDDQRAQLEEKMSQCKKEEWPVSKAERERDRKEFNRTLMSVLTDEQKATWKSLRKKQEDKWRHHDMKHLGKGDKDDE